MRIERPDTYRQSILAKADDCLLSARFELEGKRFTNAAQARGIIFHRFMREVLRTLWRTGEEQIPHAEALQVLYEVARQVDVPPEDVVMVPARERRMLRILVLKVAGMRFDCTRLIDVEQKLEAEVSYPGKDGGMVRRTISGTPDALLADPPGGAIVLDYKTAPSAPAAGDQPHWSGDHLHVSYGGYFQQRDYALLVMRNFPSVERVTLREWYVLPDEIREATVPRAALEHIEEELALDVELLDRAIDETNMYGISPTWQPSPGVHCNYCRRPGSCPIEREALVAQGGLTSDAQAARVAADVAVADQVRSEGLKALKGRFEATGRPIPVKDSKGRHEWRWGKDSSGKRRFKLHVPERVERYDDTELAKAFAEATERAA